MDQIIAPHNSVQQSPAMRGSNAAHQPGAGRRPSLKRLLSAFLGAALIAATFSAAAVLSPKHLSPKHSSARPMPRGIVWDERR